MRQRWAQADATAQAAHASGPALLFHGDADTMAPVRQAQRFAKALDEAGKEVEAVIVAGAGHSYDRAKQTGRPLTLLGRQAAEQITAWLATIAS